MKPCEDVVQELIAWLLTQPDTVDRNEVLDKIESLANE